MDLSYSILKKLNEIGIALSEEHDIPRLHERILQNAKELTHADGGTIYTVLEGKKLRFETILSNSLKLHLGGTSSNAITFEDIPLFLETGQPNNNLIVTYSVNYKQTVNIEDAYKKGANFSGTREFDAQTGYLTKAVLTIPMKNYAEDVIAVLQLLNPTNPIDGTISSFSQEDIQLAESFASQAAIALNNQLLIRNLRELFEAVIRMMTSAIDEISPSTGNHAKRVPLITELLAEAINRTKEGPFKEFLFNHKQLYELKIAALLHDCGKITIPTHIIEKRKKLESVYDRSEIIDVRFKGLEIKEENHLLKKKLDWLANYHPDSLRVAESFFDSFDQAYHQKILSIKEDQKFIHRCNDSTEPVTSETIKNIDRIASLYWNENEPILTSEERENLLIPEGNLTEKEQSIIRNHSLMTYRMLSQIPFPKELSAVPEIAASHHERMDGKGYPRGLKGQDILIQSRILAIADVFESLSSPDRPYRKPATISEVLKTMSRMVKAGYLDPSLFDIFIKDKVYLKYAIHYLMPEQIDV
ncbi:MAG: HD domain-containing phosphohydrolase [Chlamydiales bacterium]